MLRTFKTHKVRKCEEITGKLWDFKALSGEKAGKNYKMLTPCCLEVHPDFMQYRGKGEFTTEIYASGNIRLEFKGVSHTAEVYFDGEKIAEHYNAYTIFDTVVTNVKPGIHLLKVVADNSFGPGSALHIPNDYMSYCGITRPVVLEEIGGLYIERVLVTPLKKEDGWHARVSVKIKNCTDENLNTDISLEFTDKYGRVLNITGASNTECRGTVASSDKPFSDYCIPAKGSIEVAKEFVFEDVDEWNPETPELYFVRAVLSDMGTEKDDLIERFGFREIRIIGKQVMLNGKPVYIKGFCRHEEHPQFGCSLPVAAMQADLDIMKDLGANAVRTTHYPNDEVFLDLCDEEGILVWEENHARGLSEENMRNPNFEPQAERCIEEMIPAHYNHPSIYIWGILNECSSDTEYGEECYEKQINLIKKLDQTRPVSYASCKFKTDICFGLADVVSYNIYPGWYHDTPADEYLDDLYKWVQSETEGAGKPFLITEVGAGGIYGCRERQASKWSEEYQAKLIEKLLSAIMNYRDCMGVYIWQFCDGRISEEWWFGRPRTMNNKGIVDEYRRPKLAYDVVKEYFHRL